VKQFEATDNEELYGKILSDEDRLDHAYKFAKKRHDATGAVRKFSKQPYIVHPLSVAEIVDAYTHHDTDLICAAYLHDTVEDTPTSWDELNDKFGEQIADTVSELTNNKEDIKKLGKENYMSRKMIDLSDDALIIKLADQYYNINDHPGTEQHDRIVKNVTTLKRNRQLKPIHKELIHAILSC
jgi:(p)ppGpp synthase/HD superfamily hydrolase